MPSPTVDQLAAVLGQTGELVAGVTAPQWNADTPCAGWDVRALVEHVVAGNLLFAAALRGDQPQPTSHDDLGSAFAQSAAELLAAFRTPDALQRVVHVPFGAVPGEVALHLRITELLVHGWDIAAATGQVITFDEEVAKQELEFSRGAIGAIPPDRRPFGPPQPAPENAAATDTLAALLGRSVLKPV